MSTIRRLLSLLLLVPVLAGCGSRPGASAPPPLPLGVRARLLEQSYVVHGLTRAEIARSMSEEADRALGTGFLAEYDWRIRWQFRTNESALGCEMQSTVNLESTLTMPRWVDRARAAAALVAEWDRYLGALRTHENGHRDIAYRAAADIQRALRRLRGGSCSALAAEANRLANEILERRKRENRLYDEETRHGATQGASWRASSRR